MCDAFLALDLTISTERLLEETSAYKNIGKDGQTASGNLRVAGLQTSPNVAFAESSQRRFLSTLFYPR